ncbi:MAG: ABC transporter permease [Malacoplasma sp.]
MNKLFIYKNKRKEMLLLIPFVFLTLLFIIIPMIMVFIRSLTPTNSGTISENWNFIDYHIWEKILLTLGVAIATTIICLVVGYIFAYFLSLSKKKVYKILSISLITSPIWMSMLMKLVGLKTLFDYMNGSPNSTYGNIYTIIALVYINLPLFILTIYNFLDSVPKNLVDASKDLGKNVFQTFFFIIVPYTKNAIISGLSLVFFSSFTAAGVSKFVNNSNDGDLIGGEILDQGQMAPISPIAMARVSALALTLSIFMLTLYLVFLIGRKIYKKTMLKRGD